MGRYDDRYFLHMAGAGLDARFFSGTNPDFKRRVGWLAYLPAAAVAMKAAPAQFVVTTESAELTVRSPLVAVANGGAVIHPSLRLHRDIRSDDGWLDVLVFTTNNPAVMARSLVRMRRGRKDDTRGVVALRCRRVSIGSTPEVPFQVDGDTVGTTPVAIEIAARAIRLVVPER